MVRKVDLPSDSYDPDDAEFVAKLESLKVAIRKIYGARHTLVKAGADEGKLLHLLALVPQSNDFSAADETKKRKRSVAAVIRKRKEEWESLASQMEALAGHVDRLSNDPLSSMFTGWRVVDPDPDCWPNGS